MDRRSTLLSLTSGVVTGPELMQNLQAGLTAFDKNTVEGQNNLSRNMGKLGLDEVTSLNLAAQKMYESCARYGGGPNRRIAIALLHETNAAAQEKQAPIIQKILFQTMASLADSIAVMSWHESLAHSAQSYFQLALRAAHAAQDRLIVARILKNYAWLMHYLGNHQDSLNLLHLAQTNNRHIAEPQVKVMLYSYESWAQAALGQQDEFERTISLAEDYIAYVNSDTEPYWVHYCDTGHLAGMRAGGYRLLALHNPRHYAEYASELNLKAIALRAQKIHRRTAIDYIGLAEGRFLLKDTELAINATEKAIEIYKQLQHRCGSTRRRLHDLYNKYTNQATQSRQLQLLNTKLKSVLAIA